MKTFPIEINRSGSLFMAAFHTNQKCVCGLSKDLFVHLRTPHLSICGELCSASAFVAIENEFPIKGAP